MVSMGYMHCANIINLYMLVATVAGVEYLSRPHYRLSLMPSVAALRGDICDVVDCRLVVSSAVCVEEGADGEQCGRRFCDDHKNHDKHAKMELRDRSVMTGGGRKRAMPSEDQDSPDKKWTEQEIGCMKKPMLEKALEMRRISLGPGVKRVVANMKAALVSHMSGRDTGAEIDVATCSSNTPDMGALMKRLLHLEEENRTMKHQISHLTTQKLEMEVASKLLLDEDEDYDDADDEDEFAD